MKEEDEILKKVGTGNVFKVPDGYFENLTSEVMNKLPEKEKSAFEVKKTTKWDKIKPLAYMAAMFVGAAFIIRIASVNYKPEITEMVVMETAAQFYGLSSCSCYFSGAETDAKRIWVAVAN